MLIITDSFSFNAVSNNNEGSDINVRVQHVAASDIKEIFGKLIEEHGDYKSILQTKKTSEDFSKILGIELQKFTSKFFTREDFLKISRTNSLLYGEVIKHHDTKAEYRWFIISIPSTANIE